MKFVGVDLAWSERNCSGVAVIDSSVLLTRACATLVSNDEICDFAGIGEDGGAIVAIDAPLVVRNRDGCRPVEERLTDMFWPYDAGPYPANLGNASFQASGRIAGFVKRLRELGFVHRMAPLQEPGERTLIEVFPSPAQVVLFPAQNRRQHIHSRALRYKSKRGRNLTEVHSEWEIYRARLRSLEYRSPAIKLDARVKEMLNIDITGRSGARYKPYDDLLDGIFCAYLAFYFWYVGKSGCWTIGDLDSGCITLPKCPLKDCPLDQEFVRQTTSNLRAGSAL